MEFNKQQIKDCFNNHYRFNDHCGSICEDCELVGLPKESGEYVYTCKLMLKLAKEGNNEH